MSRLTEALVSQYIELYESHYGERLNDEEGANQAQALYELVILSRSLDGEVEKKTT